MRAKKELQTKSNSGFSLITVILAVGLVGILVMLVAYIVIANFRMKMSRKTLRRQCQKPTRM